MPLSSIHGMCGLRCRPQGQMYLGYRIRIDLKAAVWRVSFWFGLVLMASFPLEECDKALLPLNDIRGVRRRRFSPRQLLGFSLDVLARVSFLHRFLPRFFRVVFLVARFFFHILCFVVFVYPWRKGGDNNGMNTETQENKKDMTDRAARFQLAVGIHLSMC